MTIKPRPEFTNDYPAIDGIAKKQAPSPEEVAKRLKHEEEIFVRPAEQAIRSDIEKLMKLDDLSFDSWYNEHKNATDNLLRDYEILVSIPDLRYGAEEQKLNLGRASSVISSIITELRYGLDCLEKIKQVRAEDYKD